MPGLDPGIHRENSSFRDAPSVGNCRPEATGPESITTIGNMDCGASCYSGVAAKAGDRRDYLAYDNAPAALDISWCGSCHHQDIADGCVDVLQRHDGDRGG